MKYLKIFTDFAEDMQALSDVECGRLFRAMLSYASSGEIPDLRGNERFVWGTAKKSIDNQLEAYKVRCETNKRIATNRYETLPENTKRDESYQDKEKDEGKNKSTPPYNPPKGEWAGLVHEDVKSAFLDFIENRKKLKKPMTERAMTMLANRLNELTSDPKQQVQMLNEAILHGWQSVYPPKQEKGRAAVAYIQSKYSDDELLGMAVNLDD